MFLLLTTGSQALPGSCGQEAAEALCLQTSSGLANRLAHWLAHWLTSLEDTELEALEGHGVGRRTPGGLLKALVTHTWGQRGSCQMYHCTVIHIKV